MFCSPFSYSGSWFSHLRLFISYSPLRCKNCTKVAGEKRREQEQAAAREKWEAEREEREAREAEEREKERLREEKEQQAAEVYSAY